MVMSEQRDGGMTVEDVLLRTLDEYQAFLDYNHDDLLLKLITSAGATSAYKEEVGSLVTLVRDKLTGDLVPDLQKFLDLLLVKNSTFVEKYLEWQRKLGAIELKVLELEKIKTEGVPLKLHKGLIICSATDSNESQVIEHYGGSKWKRILNFLLGTNNPNEVGKCGGQSYVSLKTDDTFNHAHTCSNAERDSGDIWKSAVGADAKFKSATKPGVQWKKKQVYPEIAALGWSTDFTDGASPSGTSRYVKPHFNIPPYKDVYIWECVDPRPKAATEVVESVPSAGLSLTQLRDTGATAKNDPDSAEISMNELSRADIDSASINSLRHLTRYDTWCVLVSDELQASPSLKRYDSRNATLKDLADISAHVLFQETLQVHKRYLFKETYKYLISQIQDRIFLLLKRLSELTEDTENLKLRASPGQYIMVSTGTDISDKYTFPVGCQLVKLQSGVFLRGTPLYTAETAGNYLKYSTFDESAKATDVSTGGGLATVPLYGINFPKHLHWSTILTPMDSVHAVEASDSATGGSGTDLFMGDPVSGGVKYGFLSGTGNYHLTVNETGSTTAIYHNNIPPYRPLVIYQVVKG